MKIKDILQYINNQSLILLYIVLIFFTSCKNTIGPDPEPFNLFITKEKIDKIGTSSFEISSEGGKMLFKGFTEFEIKSIVLDDNIILSEYFSDYSEEGLLTINTLNEYNISIDFHANCTGKLRKIEITFHPKWNDDMTFIFWQFSIED